MADLASLHSEARWDWKHDAKIIKGIQACKLLRIATMPAVPLRRQSTRLGHGNHENKEQTGSAVVGAGVDSHPAIEEDFTTKGPRGNLKCPFSRIATAQRPVENVDSVLLPPAALVEEAGSVPPDPIAAEFHHKSEPSRADSAAAAAAAAAAGKCPIRYMDQHSPEEVAKYFENHKHEIPRSHEICVKRYQANEASIRSLDAKYGSLVKMIQGLGEMHKPMLPGKAEQADAEDGQAADEQSMENVEKWARDCADGHVDPQTQAVDVEDQSEVRTGHFERPLREVRLGESPSRPWGIQVPYSEQLALSSQSDRGKKATSTSSPALPPPLSVHEASAPKAPTKCPFHNLVSQTPQPAQSAGRGSRVEERPRAEAEVLEDVKAHQARGAGQPQIVFSGPVFFGYPAEAAARMMQSLREGV